VVFLGDSITLQKLYSNLIEVFALTRFPEWNLHFWNAGWNGDTAPGGLARLDRDVLSLNPTLVSIGYGMNDGYGPFDPANCKAYVKAQDKIAHKLKEKGVRVVFLTSQPVEEKRTDPDKDVHNLSLRQFSDALKTVAASNETAFVDQFDPYMTLLVSLHATNADASVGGGGAVHPGPAGQTLMAWIILKTLGAPSLVSSADVDAATGKVTATEGCRIENIRVADGVLRFDRLDQALPMPVLPNADGALSLVPVLNDLSRYMLKVSGLKASRYILTVDGEKAGEFTSEELAAGCNLTRQAGPITKQSQQVMTLVNQKNAAFFVRWRNVQIFQIPAWLQSPDDESKRKVEMDKMDKSLAGLDDQINVIRKPKTHCFELKPMEQTAALR
jgi:lysophospholipase L1-like esterase